MKKNWLLDWIVLELGAEGLLPSKSLCSPGKGTMDRSMCLVGFRGKFQTRDLMNILLQPENMESEKSSKLECYQKTTFKI